MSRKYTPITNLSAIPTISDLYKASRLHPQSPLAAPSSSLNSRVSFVQTSITTLAVTSIVNAANKSLLGGGGVDGVIHSAAGPSLLAECRALNGCPTGSAKITSAYALPCEYIIHAVGPVYQRAKRERSDLPAELLTGCYRTSLQLAAEKGGSIAFSCLSTGIYGYPSGEAAEVATREVRRFLLEQEDRGASAGLERVIFCCFEDKDVRAYEEWLPKIFPPTPFNPPDPPTTSNNPSSPPSDPPAEDWETVEKPDDPSPAARASELHDEGVKIDAVDASASASASGDVGDAKEGVGHKHGLLKDW